MLHSDPAVALGKRAQSRFAAPAASSGLPARAGLGFKPQHVRDVLESHDRLGFVEVHAENYMIAGGPLHRDLERIRECYPLSLHGVGLSIGGVGHLDESHLERLAGLIERYEPAAFSEHLAWSTHAGAFLNDLLPLPYEPASLQRVCAHVERAQERLGMRMLLENPATYVEFESSTMTEAQFLSEVLRRTGCGLLLDVNNAYVSCVNHGRDVRDFLDALPLSEVREIHLAGYARERDAAGAPLLIDSHGAPVDAAVWQLYAEVIERIGSLPTLLERDNDIPAFNVLMEEVGRAEHVLRGRVREDSCIVVGPGA